MSITHAIGRFATGTYTVTRAGVGSRISGVWIDGTPTVFADVSISIQPLPFQSLKTLPEGQRVEDNNLALTVFQLRERDVVTVDGEAWSVFDVENWNKRGVTWVRCRISRDKIGM